MRKASTAVGVILASVLPAAAEAPPLLCFGNEPSWSLALEKPGTARLLLPDEAPAEYQGTETRLEPMRERAWRGTRGGAAGSELVAFLREAECSDGMSDSLHPVVARVSLPDGRFLAGCCRLTGAGTPAPSEAAPGAAPLALEGPVWRLTRLRGQDPQALAAVPQGVTARFAGGRLQAFAGCNQLAGSYTLEGDRVSVGTLAGTLMACPEPRMEVEAAVKEALAGALRFHVDGDRLTLAAEAEADPRLVFEVAPTPRLEGVTWEITGFNNGRQAVVSPLIGTMLTVSFQGGSIVGHAGCNTFRATYTQDGTRLRVGPAAATRMICDAKGVMEQERQFLAALESATTWAIERGMLDLHRADGERVLVANPLEN